MYGKLIDGVLHYAPKKIKHGDSITYNPPVEMLIQEGYKPIIESEAPEAPDGYHYELSYADEGENIVYVWTLTEDEVSPDEIMNILLGEEE